MFEKTLESPLDSKEIQPVHPKGNQHWIFIGRTDAEAETPVLWPPDVKSWLIWKDPEAGKDWGQEEKRTTEDDMVGWHHWLDRHGFWWTPELAMDWEAWRAAVHGVIKNWTWLSNWTEFKAFSLLSESMINVNILRIMLLKFYSICSFCENLFSPSESLFLFLCCIFPVFKNYH